MTIRFVGSITLAVMLAFSVSASGDFTLSDQFGRAHTRAEVFAGGATVIVAGAQRKTPDAMTGWVRALQPRLPDGTRLFGLSNLKKLPFFVPKGSVKRTLADKLPKTPVLLDWKGKVYPALRFPDGATVVVGVFESSGSRIGFVSGEVDDQRLDEVLELVAR